MTKTLNTRGFLVSQLPTWTDLQRQKQRRQMINHLDHKLRTRSGSAPRDEYLLQLKALREQLDEPAMF